MHHCLITLLSWFHREGVNTNISNFPLESGCEDYSFLDLAVKDFQHVLDFILTDSINTPTLDASFDEVNAMPLAVCSGCLCLVSTISNNLRLQLVPSIKSYKLWCQARALLLPVTLTCKIIQQHSDSRLLCHPITSP